MAAVRAGTGSEPAYPKEQLMDGEMNEQPSFMLPGTVFEPGDPSDQCTQSWLKKK